MELLPRSTVHPPTFLFFSSSFVLDPGTKRGTLGVHLSSFNLATWPPPRSTVAFWRDALYPNCVSAFFFFTIHGGQFSKARSFVQHNKWKDFAIFEETMIILRQIEPYFWFGIEQFFLACPEKCCFPTYACVLLIAYHIYRNNSAFRPRSEDDFIRGNRKSE